MAILVYKNERPLRFKKVGILDAPLRCTMTSVLPCPRGVNGYHAIPQESDGILVPRDGVIGGTNPCIADTVRPGNYLVTTEIDESIYKDKLFANGEKVDRKPSEWKTVFRSRAVKITVPEKP